MPDETVEKPITCGIVMPISDIEGYAAGHWAEVKAIITEAVESIRDIPFRVELVSDDESVGVIQKRIVQRLYADEIIVCDVSAKNANVMFELGMRLAFDKPTVIIKDDRTPYIFDTGPLEHIKYPADLRYGQIEDFKGTLAQKVKATYTNSIHNADTTSYLKSFGAFQVAKIPTEHVEGQELMLGMLKDMQAEMASLRRSIGDASALVQRVLSQPVSLSPSTLPLSSLATIGATAPNKWSDYSFSSSLGPREST